MSGGEEGRRHRPPKYSGGVVGGTRQGMTEGAITLTVASVRAQGSDAGQFSFF